MTDNRRLPARRLRRSTAILRPDPAALPEDYKLKAQFATDVLGRYQTQSQILLTLRRPWLPP